MVDKRKKGCYNEKCLYNEKKIKHKNEYNYCPICANTLVYVCSRCFNQLEDIDEKHKICSLCEAKDLETKQKVNDNLVIVKKGAIAFAAPIVVKVANNAVKKGQDIAIKRGTGVVNKVIEKVVKK